MDGGGLVMSNVHNGIVQYKERSLRGVVVKTLTLQTSDRKFDPRRLKKRVYTEVPSPYDLSCWWDV